MNCPIKELNGSDAPEYPDEFSEFNSFCKGCIMYTKCQESIEKNEQKRRKDMKKDNDNFGNTLGDNFPTYGVIHNKLSLHRNRQDMIAKLLIEEMGKITQEDILDMQIDIELYNKSCRKENIKRRYSRKKKSDDNI